jgi:hypothetical protein
MGTQVHHPKMVMMFEKWVPSLTQIAGEGRVRKERWEPSHSKVCPIQPDYLAMSTVKIQCSYLHTWKVYVDICRFTVKACSGDMFGDLGIYNNM